MDPPGEAIKIDTLELLDQLEDLVEESKPKFLNKVFINIENFYELVNKIHASLPEDVKQASRITREADQILDSAREQTARIIDQAKADAGKILEDARAEAMRLVDASEIKQLATLQAKEIVASSEEEARATKAGADEYAREVLAELESFVGRVMSTIQKGRDKLEHRPGTEK